MAVQPIRVPDKKSIEKNCNEEFTTLDITIHTELVLPSLFASQSNV
jgi:hypothetical protein